MAKRSDKGIDKEAAGLSMFNDGWTQEDIARVLRVHPTTVSRWSQNGNWRNRRIEAGMVRETAEESLWQLINYQLQTLGQMTEEWKKQNANKLIDKGEIDALTKMFSAVKGKQQNWTHYVSVMREFMEELQNRDPRLAKQLIDHVDAFLNDTRQKL